MKLLVFFVIVVGNISNNGKASLDSFTPTTNILFKDTTRKTDSSCNRPCKFNVKPRRCHYSYKIEPTTLDNEKPAITINGISPGPPINVCLNDVIVVEVHNKVPGQDLALHWHGIEQKGTPYMDGVPMVTQCPISYGSRYKYAFKASAAGTFFYHADSVSQQSDGIYGSLIVNQPQPLEPHSSLYDYDRTEENTLIFAARFPDLLTGSLEDTSRWRPSDILINGVKNYKLFVLPSYAYRLRLINAIGVECPLSISVENHDVVVIATDGRPVKPVTAKKVLLYPGERMDVVVRASQENGGYWINVRGISGTCEGLITNAMFLYSGYNYTDMLEGSQIKETVKTQSDFVNGQMLESLYETNGGGNAKKIYLGVDNIDKFADGDNDFRYIRDSMPKQPFFPAPFALREVGSVRINMKNFLYPDVPILLRPREVKTNIQCSVGEESKVADVQCLQVLNTYEGELLELAIVNEGHGSNNSYTFHMHGYSMQVIGTWQKSDGTVLSKKEFEKLDAEGKIVRNLESPVIKDTITVPNKGYTLVRIQPDKGGSWLLECKACSLYSLPTAILLNIPQSIPKSVLESLPKCGSYKPPDVLLN